jgi:hypothetical protein
MMTKGWGDGIADSAGRVVKAVRTTAQQLIDEASSPLLQSAMALSPAMPAGYRPTASPVALASGGYSTTTNTSSLQVVFQKEPVSYSDTVRGVRDAQRAAARW